MKGGGEEGVEGVEGGEEVKSDGGFVGIERGESCWSWSGTSPLRVGEAARDCAV